MDLKSVANIAKDLWVAFWPFWIGVILIFVSLGNFHKIWDSAKDGSVFHRFRWGARLVVAASSLLAALALAYIWPVQPASDAIAGFMATGMRYALIALAALTALEGVIAVGWLVLAGFRYSRRRDL